MTSLLNEVERACADLADDGQPITFTAVAARTAIARSTLYRNPALHAVVEHHRHAATDQPITAITEQIATLRAAIEILAETVRAHDAQIRRLTRE